MSNPKPGRTHEMVERKVGDLWVDPNVQRSLRKARVTTIAANFKPDAVGVLTTSYRAPDRIHVIDGQHRYRAAEAAGYEGVLQTMEYRGLSIPEEAALFRLLNATEKVSRVDEFLISCVANDPDAVRLAGFIFEHGWTVGAGGATETRITAIGSLEAVYKLSPEAADATLAVLTTAFGHRAAAVQGSLVQGLGRFLARYNLSGAGLTELAKRLSGVPGGPDGLVGLARGRSFTRTGNLSTEVARIILGLYNRNRRTTSLPEWQ
jgi:hypothetical protein